MSTLLKRRFHIEFDYWENESCIESPDHGLSLIRGDLEIILPDNDLTPIPGTLKVEEVE